MEENQQFHFDLKQAQGDVVIRTGVALPLEQRKKVEVIGNIDSVRKYINRRPGINRQKALIIADVEKGGIVFFEEPESPTGAVISGALTQNPDLEQFGINKGKMFDNRSLVKLLRFNRHMFSAEAIDEVILLFQKFNAKTASEIESERDTRGNVKRNFVKTVETGLPDKLIFDTPIFKDHSSVRFVVDVCIDVTDSTAQIWFESPEMKTLQEDMKKSIIKSEVDIFEPDFAVIYQ